MMKQRTYTIRVFEVDADVTAGGCTPIEVEVASYVTESCCPWCAVQQLGEQLDVEDAS
jgi:hypothetical protein